jgi:hypothetical protein
VASVVPLTPARPPLTFPFLLAPAHHSLSLLTLPVIMQTPLIMHTVSITRFVA